MSFANLSLGPIRGQRPRSSYRSLLLKMD